MEERELRGRWDAERCALALAGRPGLAWLDADGTGEDGRFSYLACDPVEVIRVPWGHPDPIGALSAAMAAVAPEAGPCARVPRFIGYIAYDAAWSGRTRTPRRHARDPEAPVAWFARYDAVLELDHRTGRARVVADDAAACDRLVAKLEARAPRPVARIGPVTSTPAADHLRAIEAALEHIAAGDIYQVNLAREWRAPLSGDPLALFLAMRRASPVPLGFYVEAGDHAVAARTMERFLAWDGPGGTLLSRPIKGTAARRGGDDAAVAHALASDEKELAENAMIVDLMRNDLGRVAVTGTVSVPRRMEVEPYAKLAHLVSTVVCRTRPEVALRDVLAATFPPGSVTGTPKLRAIEIIEALEPGPRGVYTGCAGFIDRGGGASLAVAIRTAIVRGAEVRYHAGGGIVSASVPEREVAETELKARAFLDAVDALRDLKLSSTPGVLPP